MIDAVVAERKAREQAKCPRCGAQAFFDSEDEERTHLEWHCGSSQDKATGEFEDGIQCLRTQRDRLKVFVESVVLNLSLMSIRRDPIEALLNEAKAALGRKE